MRISYPEDWREIPPERWTRMNLTPEAYARMRAERAERDRRSPAVGDPAPDFEVERLSPEGKRTVEAWADAVKRQADSVPA